MKRMKKGNGHSFKQQDLYLAELKKMGIDPRDKVFLKNAK